MKTVLAAVAAAVAASAGTAWGTATLAGDVVTACAKASTGDLRVAVECKPNESAVSWNVQGPAGAQGPAGPAGPAGPPGPPGAAGLVGYSVVMGLDETVPPLSSRDVTLLCTNNEKAVGGGFSTTGSSGEIVTSAPLVNGVNTLSANTGDGWFLRVHNPQLVANATVTPYVICAMT